MDKYVMFNDVVKELTNGKYDIHFKDCQLIPENEFFDPDNVSYIPNLHDCVVFVSGDDAWRKIKDLHDKGLIHIGLRHFTVATVRQLPFLTLKNGLRLVVSKGLEKNSPDWSKIEFFLNNNFDRVIPKPESWDIVDLKDVKPCIDKINKYHPTEYLGFDFETRGFPLEKGFKPLGFSIVGSTYGFYVDVRNYLDWKSDVYTPVRKYIEQNFKRLVVFNCNFEIRVIEHMWQEFLQFPDAWALCLCDDYRAGLKPAAQYYLGVPSWDDDLEFEQTYFSNAIKDFKTPEDYFRCIFAKSNEYYASGIRRVMTDTISRHINDKNILEDSVDDYSKQIKRSYRTRITEAWGNEWEMSDPWTLGKYCILDSFYSKLIWDLLKGKYPRAEEIYHNNYYYGSFIATTTIPINRDRLNILKTNATRVKANTAIFYVKFYKKCLEDTIGEYVDNLNLTPELQKIMREVPWLMSQQPAKFLKEILKISTRKPEGDFKWKEIPISDIDWKRFAYFVGSEIGRNVFEMIRNDGFVQSATLRHRNQWIELGQKFEDLSHYAGFIEKINDENLRISREGMKNFNAEIIKFCEPFKPVVCRLVGWYFEDGKHKQEPWTVMRDHPEVSRTCYNFVKNIQAEWNDDYWSENYLGGETFKRMMAFVTKEDLENWRHSYNIHRSIPPALLKWLPVEKLVSVEEIVTLVNLRSIDQELARWDNVKVDDPFPEGIPFERVKWLSETAVKWSSDKETFPVAISMLKKYGWLCSAITQFWNYWWSKEHQPENDEKVLNYAIESAITNKDSWYSDFREYVYQAGDHVKKAERAVDVGGFCRRFGFERSEIRSWHWFDINKDTTMNIDKEEPSKFADWNNLYKFLLYWDLGQAATKQLNPYITRMDEDSKAIDETLADGSQVIDTSKPGDGFIVHFKICGVTTKRTSGFFHTFAPGSDEYSIVEAPEGKLLTYFDVSQAEPRMMAYESKDPNFMSDYNQGKDIYMELARLYKPNMEEGELRKKYRGKCKTLVLAIHYGMAPETLCHHLDMTLEETLTLMDSYFSRYSKAKEFIDESKEYCKRTGEIRTIFGDRLRADRKKYATAGINYVLQNSASVLMQFGFFNMVYAIRQLGIDIHPKSVIHDSNQNLINVKDLFYVDLAYKRFFREFIKQREGVDFKYDLELLKTFRDHTVYSMDFDKGLLTLSGPEKDLKYYEKYLFDNWDMKIVKDNDSIAEPSKDLYYDFSRALDSSKRGHQYCMDPYVMRTCPWIFGRQYQVSHDWENDELVKAINSMPMDSSGLTDIWMNKSK